MPAYKDASLTFVHIPKAAGSTIQKVLANFYKANPATLGHRSINEMVYRAPGIFTYTSFAVIRDPADRVYSAWKHARRHPSLIHLFEGIFKLPFSEFIMQPNFINVYNHQLMFQPTARWLSIASWQKITEDPKWDTWLRKNPATPTHDILPSYGLRFENLEEDFIKLIGRIKMPFEKKKLIIESIQNTRENCSSDSYEPVDLVLSEEASNKLNKLYEIEYKINRLINFV